MSDAGLIRSYIDKIRQVASTVAIVGGDFESEIDQIISEAIEHFKIVKTSDPETNLNEFRGRLKLINDISGTQLPHYQEALKYALNSFNRQIESKRPSA